MDGWLNWLFPATVSLTAIPKAFTAMTDSDPIKEHIERYTIGFVLPYLGTTFQIIPTTTNMTKIPYTKKPVESVNKIFAA